MSTNSCVRSLSSPVSFETGYEEIDQQRHNLTTEWIHPGVWGTVPLTGEREITDFNVIDLQTEH